MRLEPLKLRGESLLGHLDGSLESLADPGLLRLEDTGVQGDEVVGRLDRRVTHFRIEHAVERRGVVGRVEERAETALGFELELVLLGGHLTGGQLEPLTARGHRICEAAE
jgi:hypothetical protein